ncbi:hypothetical protein GCM10027515_31940 [Schumannella luteola]|uniref:Uncharacterized protein n=1 Tax=Schumannella luteola TaxID=472059 RepID=A0A852YP63_9MICO|nr:hypothetical protein [Schumannella luteola]NYG99005.1 hypothetical protein [Schumannella luteola]TPX06367.1 hypothetical protein FJ656_01670 [Schumannella luteola]
MTARMTVAITLLTIGLAVAALAGIPALVDNRSVGDVVVICGLALAAGGVAVGLTAIPGVRRARVAVERNRRADVDDLTAKRQRIQAQMLGVQEEIRKADASLMISSLHAMTLRASGTAPREHLDAEADRRALRVELINLRAELHMNENDFARLGAEVPDA